MVPLPFLLPISISHCLCEFSLTALPAALRQLAALQLYEIQNNFGLPLFTLLCLLFPPSLLTTVPTTLPTTLPPTLPPSLHPFPLPLSLPFPTLSQTPKNSARNEAWPNNDATLLRSATAAAKNNNNKKRKSGAIERECQTRKTSSSAVDSAANVTRGCIDCAGQWLQVTTTTTTAKETPTTQSRSQRRCRRHRHRCCCCCCCLFTE